MESKRTKFVVLGRTEEPSIRHRKCYCLIVVLMISWSNSLAAKCGTDLLLSQRAKKGLGKIGAVLAPKQTSLSARSFETDHFVIHYTLQGLSRVMQLPEDSTLTRTADSLFAEDSDAEKGEAEVYALLDALGSDHPKYIRVMSEAFEEAHRYYVDTLGMRTPFNGAASRHFTAAGRDGKFTIDVVDLNSAEAAIVGNTETYGIALPPPTSTIAFENDFLFRAFIDLNGTIQGDSISSRYNGTVVNNYVTDWEKGIRVTAYHEYYHAIQFAYVEQLPNSPHFWYESSATGMEERLAPDVNDYLQYLPTIYEDHAFKGMFEAKESLGRYGFGVFHQFLTASLDPQFDVILWQRLRNNSNNLTEAFEFTLDQYGRSMDEIYPAFAKQLVFAADSFKAPVPKFSQDASLWPTLSPGRINQQIPQNQTFDLPPLAFEWLELFGDPGESLIQVSSNDAIKLELFFANRDSINAVPFQPGNGILPAPRENFQQLLLVSNTSYTSSLSFSIESATTARDTGTFAYPNPVRLDANASLLRFTKSEQPIVSVSIYDAIGNIVRKLNFLAQEPTWTWDLRDMNDNPMPSGVYYYQADHQRLQSLILLD